MSNAEAVAALIAGKEAWTKYERANIGQMKTYDFSGTDFTQQTLGEVIFGKHVDFTRCHFAGWPFSEKSFPNGADFSDAVFSKHVNITATQSANAAIVFQRTIFEGRAHLEALNGPLVFNSARFEGGLNVGPHCNVDIKFEGATEILGHLTARKVVFAGSVSFVGSRLLCPDEGSPNQRCELDFRGATFRGDAAFSDMLIDGAARFDGAKFENGADFRGTVFGVAPAFHEATIHQETKFDPAERFDRQFPDTDSANAEARYRTLKELMGKYQALGDQLGFARLEMKTHGKKLGLANLYRAYALIADYGLSWIKPTVWLIVVTIASFLGYGFVAAPCIPWMDERLVALALSNTLPFVSALKTLGFGELDVDLYDSARLQMAAIAIGQNIASVILLFLIALGVRNRLRMK